MGRQVQALLSNYAYGTGKMDKLVEQLKRGNRIVSTAALYNAQVFSRTYPKSELPKLLGLKFSQVSWLVSIDDSERRDWYRSECLKQKWSSRQLQAQIREEFGKRSSGGAPFTNVVPLGPRTALGRWVWLRDACQNKCVPEFVKHLKQLGVGKRGKIDPKTLELIQEANCALTDLSKAVKDAQSKLCEVRKALQHTRRT